jgi:hypothetical protein
MKIRPAGAESFHAAGQTDKYEEVNTVVAFRNFAKAANNMDVKGSGFEDRRHKGGLRVVPGGGLFYQR